MLSNQSRWPTSPPHQQVEYKLAGRDYFRPGISGFGLCLIWVRGGRIPRAYQSVEYEYRLALWILRWARCQIPSESGLLSAASNRYRAMLLGFQHVWRRVLNPAFKCVDGPSHTTVSLLTFTWSLTRRQTAASLLKRLIAPPRYQPVPNALSGLASSVFHALATRTALPSLTCPAVCRHHAPPTVWPHSISESHC